jgi:membrane-associated phospholipid phosphatase
MAFSDSKNIMRSIQLSLATALLLFFGTAYWGKFQFFLLLNADLGNMADTFFRYWTNMGDGAIWVLVVLLTIIFRKKEIPAVIAAIILSTFFTQFIKNVVFPDAHRPTFGITDFSAIHTVAGVELHLFNSMPSGHTATAFTIFLLAGYLIKKTWILPVGFLYAALVGYSRIYLAQHFPVDVAAGILTAITSFLLSLAIQKKWDTYIDHKTSSKIK